MSEEKKNTATEEVKEEARKLSMEKLEKVNGGVGAAVQVKGDNIAKLNEASQAPVLPATAL